VIHVTCLTVYPTGTPSNPIVFESLADAQTFSRITGRHIYAATREGIPVWQIWPGGRTVEYGVEVLDQMVQRRERRKGADRG
jgi:hypothetical protein